MKKILFVVAALLCFWPTVASPVALLLGIAFALTVGNPFVEETKKLSPKLLSYAIIGLGAGMDLGVLGRVGLQGIGYTVVGISFTLTLGLALGRLFKTERETSILLASGTAICGGSAIAAIAPTIAADSRNISLALGIVFLLNSVALLLFPPIGHFLHLSERQFGLWAALAIHDTSSVVGASLQYGAEALKVGATVKLARALWIVPLALASSYIWGRANSSGQKPKKPYFILGFVLTAALVTYVPILQMPGHYVELVARRFFVVTLFLIGANLSPSLLRSVSAKPFLQGLLLWVAVSLTSLGAILLGWIR